MGEKVMVKHGSGASLFGPIWFIGWLFTIGYCHLHMVRAAFALLLWPYYLGAALGHAPINPSL